MVESKLVRECKLVCRQSLCKNNSINLFWVPGHSGIIGNEEADMLARAGAEAEHPRVIQIGITTGAVKQVLKQRLQKQFSESWRTQRQFGFSRECIKGPSDRVTRELLNLTRKKIRGVVALVTGHGPFLSHLAKLTSGGCTTCRLCLEAEETGRHIFFDCPPVWRQRMSSLGVPFAQPKDVWDNLEPRKVGLFAEKTGLF